MRIDRRLLTPVTDRMIQIIKSQMNNFLKKFVILYDIHKKELKI
jgi:hypothetical protein